MPFRHKLYHHIHMSISVIDSEGTEQQDSLSFPGFAAGCLNKLNYVMINQLVHL